ncbi:hypothetical protein BASA81_014873 [Batrachochytrium salamandrivorans]|nr:hypothetical protein BASA81_014873 [Batrachochytrium salamandrivorans]
MRIERFVETNNLLSYEQAGFRKREECVGQVVHLSTSFSADKCWAKHPCSIHRYPKGIRYSPSWCTVMEAAEHGFPRRTLAFLRHCTHPHLLELGQDHYRTHSQYRGVRQGCPLSGCCSICSSTTFSMVSHPSQSLDYRETRTPSEDSLVSRVESYKYLGVLIDSKLDHSAWLKQKRSALEHTILALHQCWLNHRLTVNYRSRIFSAVVMGKAYYGLELVGGNKSHLAHCRQTINKGIRCSLVPDSRLPLDPFWLKLGLGFFSLALVSRVRLLERSVTKRTPINAIALSGLVPAIQKSRLRLLGHALDPGVENVYTWLSGGVLNGEADLDQRWLDGIVEHESMGTRHDNRALAARLADFLQVAYRQYQSTLWKYHGIALWKLAN